MTKPFILLEETYDEKGKYMGKVIVYEDDLTPEILTSLKEDVMDLKGWHKYRKVMREHGHDIGEVEAIE